MMIILHDVLLSTEYCDPGKITTDRLKRDLTSKCGKERRKMKKKSVM